MSVTAPAVAGLPDALPRVGNTRLTRPAITQLSARLRGPMTVAGTLLVVVVEFMLLHVVYGRAQPAEQAEIVAAASITRIETAPPSATASITGPVDDLVRAARGQVPTSDLREARTAYARRPDAATRSRVLRSASAVRTAVERRRAALDRQADYIYVGLLLVASVGWMVWFRRLVSRHRALERSVTESRSRALGDQRLAALVRSSADAIVICDSDGAVRYASPSVATVLGVEPGDVEARAYTDLVVDEDRAGFLLRLGGLEPTGECALNLRMQHADGRVLDVEGTVTNLTGDSAIAGYVVTVRDVTDRVRLEAELTRQAFEDPLTGLNNRHLFSDRLEHALRSRGDDRFGSVVVLFCDLDDFKYVNDSLGHGVGDQVLKQIGERIRRGVRPGDTVARFGGDEFTVLFEDLDVEGALAIATELLAAFAEPLIVDGRTISLGASIGLASAQHGAATGNELLRNADAAMYLAKGRGRGQIAVYDSELHLEALRRLTLRSELRTAISERQIVPYFQPVVDVRTGHIVGFEALARWIRPDATVVSPLEFIGLAEQSGLIHELGRSILEQSCRRATEFNALRAAPMSMSVNVTAQQLGREDFVDEVLDILRRTGMSPSLLTLEITESELAADLSTVQARLTALREHSVRIAIDDFGTGFNSLSYLRNLRVDTLKIDRSFVAGVAEDSHDAALTQAIIAISNSVDLVTVAEGVENVDQAAWLADRAVTLAQGFLWSQAVPAAQVRDLLNNGGVVDVPGPSPQLYALG